MRKDLANFIKHGFDFDKALALARRNNINVSGDDGVSGGFIDTKTFIRGQIGDPDTPRVNALTLETIMNMRYTPETTREMPRMSAR
jgi:hypothetical protein